MVWLDWSRTLDFYLPSSRMSLTGAKPSANSTVSASNSPREKKSFCPDLCCHDKQFSSIADQNIIALRLLTLDLQPFSPYVKVRSNIIPPYVLISGNFFSSFVSSLRQPVGCFFNWLDRPANTQFASLVHLRSGLILHLVGRIAVTCLPLRTYRIVLYSIGHYSTEPFLRHNCLC